MEQIDSLFDFYKLIEPTKKVEKPKEVTYFKHFPQCPVRMGRLYDGVMTPTCGYREITLSECLECTFQANLPENKVEMGKRTIRNSKAIIKHSSEIEAIKKQHAAEIKQHAAEIKDLKQELCELKNDMKQLINASRKVKHIQ